MVHWSQATQNSSLPTLSTSYDQAWYEGWLFSFDLLGEFLIADYGKFTASAQLHVCYLALDRFHQQYQRYPAPYNQEDGALFLEIAKQVNQEIKESYRVSLLFSVFIYLGWFGWTIRQAL